MIIGSVFAVLVVVTQVHPVETFEVDIARPSVEEPLAPLEELPPEPEAPSVDKPQEVVLDEVKIDAVEVLPLEEVLPPVDCSSMIPTIPQPFIPQTVALVKSPVTMKAVGGSARNYGGRIAAMRKYGGTGEGEDAVIRALRYLKSLQRADGSWKHKGEGDPTAFALLAFLAHGEDFTSEEFGETVRKALNYLRLHHRSNMAVYALVEAAAVIRTPVLVEEAELAVSELCQRQKAVIKANAGGVIPRFCAVMAMVSAKMAHMRVPELEATWQRFVDGYIAMRDGKANDWTKIKGEGVWHFMVASVVLQYLKHGADPNSKAMLTHLDRVWQPATLGTSPIACCPVRSNYFATMMFFNDGGAIWHRWNAGMIAAYVKTQTREGELGYWRCQDQHIGDQPFWPTAYIAQQLMIYYRYLPTYSEEAWNPVVKRDFEFRLRNWVDVEVSFGN